ncbi:Putative DNA sulfur modification protein DndA [Flavobacterium indicum GPTSA100-9 = DSM 17447]|uniref:cysteine desulfurase n=1 Tax=Flavobacterium indicum (strain DSM 17447 / CIP 109464 / GPTSA100-9) TaxID=1094466 RepID=H8XTZ1_FLAIG|nr:cysteine desulfurase family protein [Flavobacterium indicum]CCG53721.1 Putative DNA sulfur modification protein DndA [Flavobacterium indicum GPTSA100-9 = DSM 17447]
MNKELIYLDNNATTQIDQRVLDAMLPYLTTNFANANSTHQFGVGAYNAVKEARKQVAEIIGAETNEIVFTSGATEAINLAIKGVAESYSDKGKHIITVETEHSAVLDTCKFLETKGFEVTYLPVQKNGLIDLDLFKSQLREDTILVSVMMVNNETGVIQPIKELAELTHGVEAIFMTDATQAVGKLELNVDELGIDLLCFSGHKIYAPKGVGALYVRQRANRIKIPALLHGGGHERGLRSGTLNVPGIVALGKACELAQKELEENLKQIKELRDYLEIQLLTIENSFVNGDTKNRLYNVTNICFVGADSEAVIMGLSNPENNLPLIAVSNGSACTSTSIDPSHVLIAMGLDENHAFNSIRFSLGKYNTKEELNIVINQVKTVVAGLRAMIF